MKATPAKHACSVKTALAAGLGSKALQVNLEATDRAVTIDTKYLPLREVVETLPGLLQQTEAFLCELNHPFKNWDYVVREMRNYALRNFPVYYEHEKGPKIVHIIFDEWLDALSSSSDESVQAMALDNIVFFVVKIIDEGKSRLLDCMAILSDLFGCLTGLPDEQFLVLSKGYYQVKRIGQAASQLQEDKFDYSSLNRLLRRTLRTSYQYWLTQEDPATWFIRKGERPHGQISSQGLFQDISHEHLQGFMERLSRIDQRGDPNVELAELLALPGYADIVKSYRGFPQRIEEVETDAKEGLNRRLASLVKIIETRGLASIHEDALSLLNQCLGEIIHTRQVENVEDLLDRTFEALQQSMDKFPEAALQAVENVGKEIFKSNDSDMVDLFIQHTIDLGFQSPDLSGTTAEWKVQVNPAHLANTKAWLHLIENNPKWSKRLISALIINLRLGGLYIKDTDLFHKEISLFFNSPVAPCL